MDESVENERPVTRERREEREKRSAPSPAFSWIPGTVLLAVGLPLAADGGNAGWALTAVGLALLLVGAVAQGVSWGMEMHAERHP